MMNRTALKINPSNAMVYNVNKKKQTILLLSIHNLYLCTRIQYNLPIFRVRKNNINIYY